MSTVQEQFEQAVQFTSGKSGKKLTRHADVSNERKLTLYKYFKQAKSGDVTGSQPWAIQVEARAKWDAWNSVKGTSTEDAMKAYVEEVEAQKTEFGPVIDM